MAATRDPSFLQRIPAVDQLLRAPQLQRLAPALAHGTVVALVREVLDETRRGFLAGDLEPDALTADRIVGRVVARAATLQPPPLRRVINATGILIHTNLGRSPLSAGAQQAVADIFAGYSNLEMDLTTGRRTSRLGRVRDLLTRVTGAEDGFAVNNNAAAVYLTLYVLCSGREAVCSRGELVEIGGSFRLPDIMAASGAILREVGTTNRTRLADYRQALSAATGVILKVHPSNYAITGYTEGVTTEELAGLAREQGVVMLEDLGSGALEQHPAEFLSAEPRVQAVLRAGVDLVCFSADKLLGGPQAGILLGRRDLIDRLRSHPLARAVRLDKLHLAALEATLIEYLAGSAGLARIPLYRLMCADAAELRRRGATLIETLRGRLPAGWKLELIATEAAAGGGSLPGQTIASAGVAIQGRHLSAERLARLLREGVPAIVGRILEDRLVLDLRALLEEDWLELPELLAERLPAAESATPEGKESS